MRLRTSASRKRRWPPSVRRDGRRPSRAQRETVFPLTPKSPATWDTVSSSGSLGAGVESLTSRVTRDSVNHPGRGCSCAAEAGPGGSGADLSDGPVGPDGGAAGPGGRGPRVGGGRPPPRAPAPPPAPTGAASPGLGRPAPPAPPPAPARHRAGGGCGRDGLARPALDGGELLRGVAHLGEPAVRGDAAAPGDPEVGEAGVEDVRPMRGGLHERPVGSRDVTAADPGEVLAPLRGVRVSGEDGVRPRRLVAGRAVAELAGTSHEGVVEGGLGVQRAEGRERTEAGLGAGPVHGRQPLRGRVRRRGRRRQTLGGETEGDDGGGDRDSNPEAGSTRAAKEGVPRVFHRLAHRRALLPYERAGACSGDAGTRAGRRPVARPRQPLRPGPGMPPRQGRGVYSAPSGP